MILKMFSIRTSGRKNPKRNWLTRKLPLKRLKMISNQLDLSVNRSKPICFGLSTFNVVRLRSTHKSTIICSKNGQLANIICHTHKKIIRKK